MKKSKIAVAVILALAVLAYFAIPEIRSQLRDWQAARQLDHGRELAAAYCAGCHLEPSPDILPKRSWEVALGYMGYMLGIENLDYLSDHPDFARENVESKLSYLRTDNMVPPAPLLSDEDWDALRYYYVESASAEPLPQVDKPEVQWDLPQFDIQQTDYRADPALTTMVHVREGAQQAYIGDSLTHTIAVIGSDGKLKAAPMQFGPGMAPVGVNFIGDAAYVASIGDIFGEGASADKAATISALSLVDNEIDPTSISVLIDGLYRMAAMDVADINGDGRLDFVVCGFGGRQGNLAWYESRADGSYREHVLIERAGAVMAAVDDFNADGHPDIAVLMSDAREGFYVLINDGSNGFETHTVFETHPSYGHTYFELQDFNDDGLMDIMAVNGDNVDSDPYNTLKNFHGVRIYLNRGDLAFEEAFFFPLYGAFGARAADFDNDGDLDIAAISFYPDFSRERRESFVYLQNEGEMAFTAHSSDVLINGRWMTLGVGDLDGDADVDIVLGGGYIPTGMFAYMDVYQQLAESGPSVLILRNTSN